MKVPDASFMLMGHMPYSVIKFSIQSVYEYDIYMSVPSSPDNVSALRQQMQTQKCCAFQVVAMENDRLLLLID